jgi:hypothetical protein
MIVNMKAQIVRPVAPLAVLLFVVVWSANACGGGTVSGEQIEGVQPQPPASPVDTPSKTQGPYTVVYDVYFNTMEFPERGNELIAANQGIFGDRFYACMYQVHSKFDQAAANHYKFCDEVHGDPDANYRCRQENEPAKVAQWLSAIEAAAREQVLWSETLPAQAGVIAKQIVGDSAYVQLVRATVPPYRPYMLCE